MNQRTVFDQGFGFSFTDLISDPKAAFKEVVQSAETSVSEKTQEYLPAELYDKASALVNKEGAKLGDSLQAKAGDYMTNYASQPDVQDQAITGGINAFANQVNSQALAMANSWRAGNFFKDYKLPLAITGGVITLFFFRSTLTALVKKSKKA